MRMFTTVSLYKGVRLLVYFWCVGGEEETFCQVDSEELDALYPFHHHPIDDESRPAVLEACQPLHLHPLCAASSIFLLSPITVVSSAYLMISVKHCSREKTEQDRTQHTTLEKPSVNSNGVG